MTMANFIAKYDSASICSQSTLVYRSTVLAVRDVFLKKRSNHLSGETDRPYAQLSCLCSPGTATSPWAEIPAVDVH
jgi:hypothetical protein